MVREDMENRSRTAFIVLGVVFVVGCSGFASLFLSLVFALRSRPAVDSEVLAQAITAADLAPYYRFPGDPALCESTRKSTYQDGEKMYKYRYEAEKDPSLNVIFSFDATTNVCPVKQMAINEFNWQVKSARTMISLTESNKLQRHDDLLPLGDERFVALFLNEFGEADGMAVSVRSGNTVVSFRMLGHVIKDPKTLAAIVGPKLPPKSN